MSGFCRGAAMRRSLSSARIASASLEWYLESRTRWYPCYPVGFAVLKIAKMPRTDPGHRPAKGTLKPGASHVLGRGLGGTCEVQAKYMRGTSQAQAKGYGIAPLGIRRV